MNLRLMLEETARRYGKKTVIRFGKRRLSYASLDEASNKVANGLLRLGISKGERVAIMLPNIPEFAIIYFGIVKIGAIAVLVDTKYKIGELTLLFNDCQPKLLVAENSSLESLAPYLPNFKYMEYVINLNSKYDGQFLSYEQIITTNSSNKVEVELEPEDIAIISHNGGATNHPHGVMMSHYSMVTDAMVSGDGFQQTDKDIIMLFALPLYHAFGLVIGLLTSIYKGNTIVMVSGTGLSIGTLMKAIEKEKGTMIFGVPYIFALVVSIAEKEGINNDLSSLRFCASGGAPLSIDLINRFKQLFGITITNIWGQTEATAVVTCQSIDGTDKLGSAGAALAEWKVRVVDDDGRELAPNQPGEIIVSGPIMKGYYNNPEATADVIKDGWLYTGDMGIFDEDGYFFVTGRKKEMIIVKGRNVYPSDIEDLLYTHPKIAEAAVVGIPDELRGEIVRAAVSLKKGEVATEQEIKRFCIENMASYKLPKQIMFLDSLPKTTTGKIDKKTLAML
ncbi:class I adenylate-forming enzyme family protein [Chloroflexota bacterium]